MTNRTLYLLVSGLALLGVSTADAASTDMEWSPQRGGPNTAGGSAPSAAERPSLEGLSVPEVYPAYFEPNLFASWTEDMLQRAAVKNGEVVRRS